MIPKFNNIPNNHIQIRYETPNDVQNIDYFISRAVAVVGVVLASTDDGLKVLVVKRSHLMPDEPNKLGLPCGYLDWLETTYQAMIREVYEETSLYILDYEKFIIFDNNQKPFNIIDDPYKDKRQNISLLYITVLDFTNHDAEFPIDIEKFTCKETNLVKWMKLDYFYKTYDSLNDSCWAFNHNEVIKSAIKFNAKNFERK